MTQSEAMRMALDALKTNHQWQQEADLHGFYKAGKLCALNTSIITALEQSQPTDEQSVVVQEQDHDIFGLAHEIWAAAQLTPGEGIVDGAQRIYALLVKAIAVPIPPPDFINAENVIAKILAIDSYPVTESQIIDIIRAEAQEQGAGQRIQPLFNFSAHLQRQRGWSYKTFGPGMRTTGVCDHIRKELCEIESNPTDLMEWIDVVLLALDGAWRCGGSPDQIIETIVTKQTKNEGRKWPDWRTADPNKAIEHDRATDNPTASSGDPDDCPGNVERGLDAWVTVPPDEKGKSQ